LTTNANAGRAAAQASISSGETPSLSGIDPSHSLPGPGVASGSEIATPRPAAEAGDTASGPASNVPAKPSQRVEWLDGVRALAASFVVLHHVWLMSYQGFPDNAGPWYTGPLVYGHLAVAVFIVISGFSLTLRPSTNGYALAEGGRGFFRRRFWRIVPPYWAALIFSVLLIEVGLTTPPTGGQLTVRDVLTHTFLIQDVIQNTPPNGVFWSIAVECQIYLLFPILLWGFRKLGAMATTTLAIISLGFLHVLARWVPALTLLDRFTPQFLALFVLGMVATAAARSINAPRYAAWAGQALFFLFFLGCVAFGSRTIVEQYFWIDLLVGAATTLVFIAIMGGRLNPVRKVLAARPLAFVGQFAFSLYLIHAPILDLARTHIISPLGWTGTTAFFGLLIIGAPMALVASYLFFLGCERPFLRIRSWRMLVRSVRAGLRVGTIAQH